MPSPRVRSSSCRSWAERKSSICSSRLATAARCFVDRRPGTVGAWRSLTTAPHPLLACSGWAVSGRGALGSLRKLLSPARSFLHVRHRVDHDVREVLVDETVDDLTAVPVAADDARGLQHPQVLADQWLGHTAGLDQLVYAAFVLTELQHERDADWRRERTQQVARGLLFL